jgi:hypothetical protein
MAMELSACVPPKLLFFAKLKTFVKHLFRSSNLAMAAGDRFLPAAQRGD